MLTVTIEGLCLPFQYLAIANILDDRDEVHGMFRDFPRLTDKLGILPPIMRATAPIVALS